MEARLKTALKSLVYFLTAVTATVVAFNIVWRGADYSLSRGLLLEPPHAHADAPPPPSPSDGDGGEGGDGGTEGAGEGGCEGEGGEGW